MKVLGIALIVVALAVGIVPRFTDCQSQGRQITLADGRQIPMKCHWTGVAEIGVAVPMFLVGGMMVVGRRRNSLTGLSFLGVALGAMAIAFPAGLIGVCQTPAMTCASAMKPALLGLGGLAVGLSLVGLVLSRRVKEL